MPERFQDDFDRLVENLSDLRKSPTGRDAVVRLGPVSVTVTVELGERAIDRIRSPLLDAVHHYISLEITVDDVRVLQTSRGTIVELDLSPLHVVARVGDDGWRAALREQAYSEVRVWLQFSDPATIITWLPVEI